MYMYFINSCMFIVLKRAIKGKNIWVLISKGVVKKIEAYTVDHDQPLQYHNGRTIQILLCKRINKSTSLCFLCGESVWCSNFLLDFSACFSESPSFLFPPLPGLSSPFFKTSSFSPFTALSVCCTDFSLPVAFFSVTEK